MRNPKKILDILAAAALVFTGLAFRLLPHAPNFAPIAAIALFSGARFKAKWAILVPLIAMLLSDAVIGFYSWPVMVSVYISFILAVLCGLWLKKGKWFEAALYGSIASASIFFIATNFSVWAFTAWYPKTLSGIIDCFVLALPFFKNTLLSNVFYGFILYGAYDFAAGLIMPNSKKSVIANG